MPSIMSDVENHFFNKVRQIFSSGTVVVFTCATSKNYPLKSVSDNAEQILGFSPSYFKEHKYGWSEQIHPDDRKQVSESFKKILADGGSAINEYRFKKADGNYIWLRDEIALIHDEEENEDVIYGSSFDITSRKKAELELKESQHLYKSVVEHVKDIIYSLDAEGRLIFANRQWQEQTGYLPEESYGEPFEKFVHKKDREAFHNMLNRLVEGSAEDDTKIIRCLTKQGEVFWAEIYGKSVFDQADDIGTISGTIIDVSEEIAHQQEIERVNQKLEKRVAQRSGELQKEIEHRKEAEKKLQKRLDYEQAISKCSSLLLKSTHDKNLRESLNILLQVTGSDRVYVYSNRSENGSLYINPLMEVRADGSDSPVIDIESRIKYSEVPWWHEQLSNDKTICETIDNIPEPEKSILEGQEVKSILALPIILDKDWFGYIGFSDIQTKRQWDEAEIALLETASDLIAAFEKRKLIEKSLVQQRNYTETILDSLPNIYLLMDKDLKLVQWNTNTEKYTGYGTDELSKTTAFDLIAPEDHQRLRESSVRVKENKSKGEELTIVTKSGEKIPYFWRGYYIQLDGQKYYLSVGLDITHQKEAERKLMEEKHFNEALIESLPGIFYMIDKEGNYEQWNSNFVKELGYSSEEIAEMGPADFYSEDEYHRILEGIQEVFKEGEAELETQIVTKTGEEVPYFLTGKLFEQNGKQYLVGVGHDISDQKRAHDRIRRSEEMFRNLFLKAPAAIVMVNPDNKVQSVNESFQELFGYTEKELIGRDIDKVIVPEEEYDQAPKMPAKNYAMDSFNKEAKRRRKDGELIDVFVAGIPVFVDEDPLAGFGMYIDITEQKQFEEEIYNSLKEKHVLLQEIHHRVKNNLAVVSGLIQLQVYETDDPVIRETLMESESRIQTMALIHEKLYQSQNLSRISCDTYIGDLVETIRTTTESTEKDISVMTDIDDIELNINQAVPFALLVNEVVTNSFKHAFKERDEGKIEIHIKEEGQKLRVEICDDGVGLPENFDPQKMDSLGMTLIQNFAQQLEAECEMGSDDGMYIQLFFPLDNVRGSSASGLLD